MDSGVVFHSLPLSNLNRTNVPIFCCWTLYPLPYLLHANQSLSAHLDPSHPTLFIPWRPGDAFDPNKDTFSGGWQFRGQIRQWDHKNRRWYYHTASDADHSTHSSYTGGIIVGFLVFLLWLYSFYRLWMVWAYTLNFDGAIGQGLKGWDFLVSWVMYTINARKRKRMLRAGRKREEAVNEEVSLEEGDWEKDIIDQKSNALLCFPNSTLFENGHICDQRLFRDRQRCYKERNSDQPNGRNHRLRSRSYSFDYSTVSCCNELNRTFKSNCDFHISRYSSKKLSPQFDNEPVQKVFRPKLKIEVFANGKRNGAGLVTKSSYSTDV